MTVQLRTPYADEAAQLSAIGVRSKAFWGYDTAFMAACRDELTVTPADLADPRKIWRLAEVDGRIAGYFGVVPCDEDRSNGSCEIEALFVEPGDIGSGLGRTLFDALVELAASSGYRRLVIQSDPNALGFYEAMGAVKIGERASDSIPGRRLPLLEVELNRIESN